MGHGKAHHPPPLVWVEPPRSSFVTFAPLSGSRRHTSDGWLRHILLRVEASRQTAVLHQRLGVLLWQPFIKEVAYGAARHVRQGAGTVGGRTAVRVPSFPVRASLLHPPDFRSTSSSGTRKLASGSPVGMGALGMMNDCTPREVDGSGANKVRARAKNSGQTHLKLDAPVWPHASNQFVKVF